MSATETQLIGIVFDTKDVEKIDKHLKKINKDLPPHLQWNRQDFIRTALCEKLATIEKTEA